MFGAIVQAPAWVDDAVRVIGPDAPWGYRAGDAGFAEPTALVAMALLRWGLTQQARPALQWLAETQQFDGSVGICRGQSTPAWTTSLAILAWHAAGDYSSNVDRGVEWLLSINGEKSPRSRNVGHDTTLDGWPWVAGTHAWVEPTAWAVLALKRVGMSDHVRTREGVRLLFDRVLPGGGCNYGNTVVLGQALRPHVQPTGIALSALTDEPDLEGKLNASCHYLLSVLGEETPTASLAYGVLGLAAHGKTPAQATDWLQKASSRTASRDGAPHRLALALLAARANDQALILAAR
jgi:hypothetical protein